VTTHRSDHVVVRVNEYDGEDAVLLEPMAPPKPAGVS
jgi:hypothetical protein